MPDYSLVDGWLDRWEELRESGTAFPLDEFIGRHCQGADPELIARFREQVQALVSMNVRLQAAAMPGGADADKAVDSAQGDALLRPGYEPIPGHVLETRLGRGGFGEVWKARAPGGFHVALKFVRLERRVRASELRALETIKDIRHPHLLTVFGAYQKDGYLIIAMELAERTLDQRLHEARAQGLPGIPKEELLENLAEAAKGLDYLNEARHASEDGTLRGIQHRDIKPQNILLSGGSVKVGDFGLARCLDHSLVSHTGSMTTAYAAPEFFNHQTSNQSDQYSLAVTYCQLRGGRLPFTGTPNEIMAGHLNRQPNLSMIPADERPSVARALAKEPKDRWPSCGEFVRALRQALPGQEPLPTTVPLSATRRLHAQRWLVGGIAAALLLSGIVFVWSKMGRTTDRPVSVPGPPASPQPGVAPGTVTLAVLDFENHSQDPTLDGFRQGLRDMLVTDLTRVSKVKVVERSRLKAVLDEHKLAEGGFIDPRAAARLGKGLAARSLLTGSYVIAGDEVRVDVRLISVESGEIELADKVTGTKAEFFRLEQALAKKVLAALNVQPTDPERQALGQVQTKDFEAFRLYSAALLAQRKGQQKQAETSLRQAVARDGSFTLARRELATIEAAVLTRMVDAEKDRLARVGQVGKALQEHLARHQAVVAKSQHDAAFFAGLIVLSADAGLLGDTDRERRLLIYYWREWAEHVPVEMALALGTEVQKLVAIEGKFFQEQVDSGDYSTFLGRITPPNQYLKPELRDALHWPAYSAIWPFDFGAREGFRVVHNDQGIKVGPEFFEKRLPRYPHDYLRRLLDNPRGKPAEPAFTAAVRLQQAILLYYNSFKNRPADLGEQVGNMQASYLRVLDQHGPEKWDRNFVLETVPGLEALATTSPDGAMKQEANRLLLQYVRQAKMNAGEKDEPGAATPAPAPTSPVTFCSLRLDGPRIVFVLEPGRRGDYLLTPFVRKELTNAVRALSPATRFNIVLSGSLKKDAKVVAFPEARLADNGARQGALTFIEDMKKHTSFDGDKAPNIDLGTAIASALTDWPADDAGKGDVCVITFMSNPKIAPPILEQIKKLEPGRPRIHFVGSRPMAVLGELISRSGGSGVLLTEGDLLQVTPKPWNLSK